MKLKILAGFVVAVVLIDAGFFVHGLKEKWPSETSKSSSQSQSKEASGMQAEAPLIAPGKLLPDADSPVTFQFTQKTLPASVVEWSATYTDGGHTAKFRLDFDAPRKLGKPDEMPMVTGDGHFYAVSGSDASSLLVALAKELEAKDMPPRTKRVNSIPFTYVVLTEHNSKRSGGGFSTVPAGDWTAMKIFLGKNTDEDEGQVFLNFNSVTGQAEFAIKDAEYGDVVLRHLASVL